MCGPAAKTDLRSEILPQKAEEDSGPSAVEEVAFKCPLNKPCVAWPQAPHPAPGGAHGSLPAPGTGLRPTTGWALWWVQQVGGLSGEGICFSWLQLEGKAEKVSPGKELASWRDFSKLFRRWGPPCMPPSHPAQTGRSGPCLRAAGGGNHHHAHPPSRASRLQHSPSWWTGGSDQRRPGRAQGGTQPTLTLRIWKKSWGWDPCLLAWKPPLSLA